MAKVRVIYDREGDALVVWFGNPDDEDVCDEADDDVILMKDSAGRVIGFEKLNFSTTATGPVEVAFEAVR
jgi:uncharacterized protein YuzE